MLIINLVLFLAACIVLVLSGTFLVKSLAKIASFLKLGEFVVAFIIMAFATSIPELLVGITSAFAKNSALSLGNVIGANIIDLTFVAGVITLLKREIKITNKAIKIDALYMFFIASLPVVLMIIGNGLSRIDGVILLVAFAIYMRKLMKQRIGLRKELKNHIKRWDVVFSVFIFIVSLAVLFLSAQFVVQYATAISADFMLPPILIGLFLVSIGTTLPELTFESRAVLSGHSEMALGDLIGSVVVNSTLVLGVTSLIYPISANFLLFLTSSVFMLIVAFLFSTFVESGNKLYWKEGIALILLYMFFIIIEFYIKMVAGA
ncbi:sodium:calcium antiporter [Candidatus Woesearchaeota archaeon]|nr:sodium:calcium antiporter [Candidatus Woesearchaeota archaeon]